jgi:hypothetical protein
VRAIQLLLLSCTFIYSARLTFFFCSYIQTERDDTTTQTIFYKVSIVFCQIIKRRQLFEHTVGYTASMDSDPDNLPSYSQYHTMSLVLVSHRRCGSWSSMRSQIRPNQLCPHCNPARSPVKLGYHSLRCTSSLGLSVQQSLWMIFLWYYGSGNLVAMFDSVDTLAIHNLQIDH